MLLKGKGSLEGGRALPGYGREKRMAMGVLDAVSSRQPTGLSERQLETQAGTETKTLYLLRLWISSLFYLLENYEDVQSMNKIKL